MDQLHQAVKDGNLRETQALLTRKKMATSRDSKGLGLLHKAVLHGHQDLIEWLINRYPETMKVKDNVSKKADRDGSSMRRIPDVYARIITSNVAYYNERKETATR